ncbi:MAG: type II toxin-antitoxin system YafQ family toxin [Bacteroides sp.]|nr:type II toxin-antitoxin system YafQ family toxin [Bacteroides sp.]MCM1085263.1 type II toxin-antitoxin system YafQ family toxin [Bacteroides sp.]MCM1168689.1 type II toxin-antitoxin system YafQ family toxin [Bacteroides sp.]
MKELILTTQFKKDLKRYRNKPSVLDELKIVLRYLAGGEDIPSKYRPHRLKGVFNLYMECHIQNDTLLLWRDENSQTIKLVRLGSHSEIF